jgi:hypothetical protein
MKTPLVATFFSGGLCSEESWRIADELDESPKRQLMTHRDIRGRDDYFRKGSRCAASLAIHWRPGDAASPVGQILISKCGFKFAAVCLLRWPTWGQSLYDCALKQGILQD